MTRKYLLAATVLAGLGIVPGQAQDAPKEMTMSEYARHLIEVYGDTGVIIAGTISGKTRDGHFVTDVFPSPDPEKRFFSSPIKTLSLSVQEAPCDSGQVITRLNSGPFSYPWCAKYQTLSGTAYEAKRDTLYYAAGRWTYVVSTRFDCQNSSDLAQMPSSVRLAVCN